MGQMRTAAVMGRGTKEGCRESVELLIISETPSSHVPSGPMEFPCQEALLRVCPAQGREEDWMVFAGRRALEGGR